MSLLIELAKRFPLISFLWVGGKKEDITHWKDILRSANITNVTLAGFVENIRLPLYQAASDVLLMPYERSIAGSSGGNSASYASPMKMFEYMASKRLIISSDLPVIKEVLNENNAILIPPEDTDAWADALQNYIDYPEKYQYLADHAWQDVQQYTWIARASRGLEGF